LQEDEFQKIFRVKFNNFIKINVNITNIQFLSRAETLLWKCCHLKINLYTVDTNNRTKMRIKFAKPNHEQKNSCPKQDTCNKMQQLRRRNYVGSKC